MKELKQINHYNLKGFSKKFQKNFFAENPDVEIWENDDWIVHKRAGIKWDILGSDDNSIFYTHLSIRRQDNKAQPDWRAFQWIKNQLVGEENEGIEIYPPESRLVDTANQFHLWVFENPEVSLNIGGTLGQGRRMVSEKVLKKGPTQRKFPSNRRPKDLEENEREMERQLKEYENKPIKT